MTDRDPDPSSVSGGESTSTGGASGASRGASGASGGTSAGSSLPGFLTIGHSNRPIGEFFDLLTEAGAEVLVDVRRLPGSRAQPQFDAEALAASLGEQGIDYRRLEGLTGRRPVSHEIPFETNAWWSNRSFHNYADHALGQEFAADLGTLIDWGESARCAIMCAEAVWWRCHRRIIADHLIAAGHPVTHILGPGNRSEAELTRGAVIDESSAGTGESSVLIDGVGVGGPRVTYPARPDE